MPKKAIAFQVRWLSIDGQVRSKERLRATLETWPEICADVEWPNIQTEAEEFLPKKRLVLQGPVPEWNGTGGLMWPKQPEEIFSVAP